MAKITNIVVSGASSDLAQASLHPYAQQGCSFFLIGRPSEKLTKTQHSLLAAGAKQVLLACCDFSLPQPFALFLTQAEEALGTLDLVFLAQGILPSSELKYCQNPELLDKFLRVNVASVIGIASAAAQYFSQKKHPGTIAILSSVAGDRGRQSNYLYGCSKAAVGTFAEGLRQAYHPQGVRVLCLKPGPVVTAMTAHLSPNSLFISSQRAGDLIFKALNGRQDSAYIPRFWSLIMLAIRMIPERIYKKLQL